MVGRRGQHPPHCRILHRAPTKSCSRQKSLTKTCLKNFRCLSCKYNSWPTQRSNTQPWCYEHHTGAIRPDGAGDLYSVSITGTSATLTSAGGQLAAPHGQGGVEACQLRLPLQVVSHMAVEAGEAPREQVQHGHLTEVWPLWQRAAQSEDCVEVEKEQVPHNFLLLIHLLVLRTLSNQSSRAFAVHTVTCLT